MKHHCVTRRHRKLRFLAVLQCRNVLSLPYRPLCLQCKMSYREVPRERTQFLMTHLQISAIGHYCSSVFIACDYKLMILWVVYVYPFSGICLPLQCIFDKALIFYRSGAVHLIFWRLCGSLCHAHLRWNFDETRECYWHNCLVLSHI